MCATLVHHTKLYKLKMKKSCFEILKNGRIYESENPL